MLQRLLGLGIVALLVFLNLYTWGSFETHKVSESSPMSVLRDDQGPEIKAELMGKAAQGLLQNRSECSEMLESVRKFPLIQSFILALSIEQQQKARLPLLSVYFAFAPTKDRLAAYHILRI